MIEEVTKMAIRRVVTGERDGRSVILREEVAKRGPIANLDLIWRCEQPPVVPNDGEISELSEGFPPSGGVSVMRWEVPAGETLAEGTVTFDGDRPGFHQTDSVDTDIILSGSVVLELDDEEVLLHTGDVVILNGNGHAWRNPGDQPAAILSVIAGASRQSS